MKYYELDLEELEILNSLNEHGFKVSKSIKSDKKKAVSTAKQMMNKNTNINIRMSQVDLLKVKAQAFKDGVPYQTWISSTIHKSVA
jgi:predicted DNA binding CopG/RHH family protein